MENTPQAQLYNFTFHGTFNRIVLWPSCHGVYVAYLIIKIEYYMECKRIDNFFCFPWMFNTDSGNYLGIAKQTKSNSGSSIS